MPIRPALHRRRFIASTLLALTPVTWTIAQAADWPTKPIHLIFPYEAGGAGDLLTRELGEAMRDDLKVAFVTENKPGGGTVIGATYVARQPADGYTILINGPATNVIMPAIQPKVPYDPNKDFALIGLWAVVGNMISVNSAVPVKTVAELVAYSKKNPGKLFYSSPGAGTGPHLGAELFKQMTGADITHVPYKGAAGATLALVSGDVQVSFVNIPPQVPHVKSGKIRPLAVSMAARSTQLPDVPTAAEAGLPGYISESWFGLSVPAGTPADVRSKLEASMLKAAKNADLRAKLAANGVEVRPLPAAEFATYVAAEEQRLLPLIKKLNLQMQ
ncbi:Bug family tripartite tricarboxylate transporter substrate binding protein [Pigmentiphaga litoralis]|uniref:Tripartite-type tricarboxylate transporter receptor subunit TctC n=1 Tax=Pigmentiphaga litoralis TaxID=516702 RepID=A0A7Y9IQL4_9BURK|nr:tripartite tricarboxylate transporter substrate binding protein [Pigmentiphaga litoralis]NYE25272.1 tripartite-type tricarboxylate transporter receptor subunit TctC [Pigmentiphaga litoralis]NYE81115.1 tripartite-type tricarboxylate transporter receptor subunit TctC [Pigmentiphaga litoralis]